MFSEDRVFWTDITYYILKPCFQNASVKYFIHGCPVTFRWLIVLLYSTDTTEFWTSAASELTWKSSHMVIKLR